MLQHVLYEDHADDDTILVSCTVPLTRWFSDISFINHSKIFLNRKENTCIDNYYTTKSKPTKCCCWHIWNIFTSYYSRYQDIWGDYISQKLSLFRWFLSKKKVAASVFILNLYICYVLSSNTTYISILWMNTNAATFI